MKISMVAMREPHFRFWLVAVVAIVTFSTPANFVTADRIALPPAPFRYYHFNVEVVNYTVNCRTKEIITVNGKFPGPVLYANEGDRIIVNVTNNSKANMTIHFHGVRQVQSPWMDGVAYVTMCPLQAGAHFLHDFVIPMQRGTLLWHAHTNWQRATVHGAIVIYPATPYVNFARPYKEIPVIFAEWFYQDIEFIENYYLDKGSPFPASDLMTINGHPGPTYNCSAAEGYSIYDVVPGKTYLLRLVNAALNAHLFFAVANHTMTVVEADAEYVFPFETSVAFLSPGQTLMVLITFNQPGGEYYMSIQGYGRDNIPIVRPTAIFRYPEPSPLDSYPYAPFLPEFNDTGTQFAFTNALRTFYPGRVPLTVNRALFIAVGLSNRLCNATPAVTNCSSAYRYQAALNNITFELPTIAILQASYFNISGVFEETFPDNPHSPFDYTGSPSPPPALRISNYATRIIGVKFNDTVQIVLQNYMVLGFEDHPFHLHGHNFYVLAQGFGNYNASTDEASWNLYDPPLRNTVSVPAGGWSVIRLKANNPGVWLFHCHLDKHTSWGMMTVMHVHDGIGPNNSILAPPSHLSPC